MAVKVRSRIFKHRAGSCRTVAVLGVAVLGTATMLAALTGATNGFAQPVEEQTPVAPYQLELPSLAEELGQSDQAQPETVPADAAVSDNISEEEVLPVERGGTEAVGTAIIDGAVEAFPLPMPDNQQATDSVMHSPDSVMRSPDSVMRSPDSVMRSNEDRADDVKMPTAQGAGAVGATPVPGAIELVRNKRILLRGLDKITGRIVPLDLPVNSPTAFGSLRITARDCHKAPPEETPEISAFLEISDVGLAGQSGLLNAGQRAVLISEEGTRQVFSGWMFASSPAISALEHSVYDVSVIDCIASSPDKR